jgi:hypothetical protein
LSPLVAFLYSARSVPFHSGLRVYSTPAVTAVASEPSPPLIGLTRSKDASRRTPGASCHRLRRPIVASASRPEKASRARYSLKNCPSLK